MAAYRVLLLIALAVAVSADCDADIKKVVDKYSGVCKDLVQSTLEPTIAGQPASSSAACPKEKDALECFNEHSSDWEDLSSECSSGLSKGLCIESYGFTSFYDWVAGQCASKLDETYTKLSANWTDTCKTVMNHTMMAKDPKECPLSADVKPCFNADIDTWVPLMEECPSLFHGTLCMNHMDSVTVFAAFVASAPPPPNAAAHASAMGGAVALTAAAIMLLA